MKRDKSNRKLHPHRLEALLPMFASPLPLPFLRVRVWKIERLNKTENQISNESIEFEHRFSASLVLGSVRDSWEVSSTYPHTHTHTRTSHSNTPSTNHTHTHTQERTVCILSHRIPSYTVQQGAAKWFGELLPRAACRTLWADP